MYWVINRFMGYIYAQTTSREAAVAAARLVNETCDIHGPDREVFVHRGFRCS
jgi:hypothetical protein